MLDTYFQYYLFFKLCFLKSYGVIYSDAIGVKNENIQDV
jgi:hypothetical protein